MHIVTFSWNQRTSNDEVAALSDALEAFAPVVPGLRDYRHGPALATGRGNADYAIAAVFDGVEDVHAYLDHPEHHRIVREIVTPMLGQRQAVQIAVTDGKEPHG